MPERIDLNKVDCMYKIRDDDVETPDISKYYDKRKLAAGEDEMEIGLSIAITPRNPPKEVDVGDPKCYAKISIYRVDGKETRRYYIKQDYIGNLMNPWGMYTEGTENEIHRGSARWNFKEVTADCFWQYCMFLRTRHEVYLAHAGIFNE